MGAEPGLPVIRNWINWHITGINEEFTRVCRQHPVCRHTKKMRCYPKYGDNLDYIVQALCKMFLRRDVFGEYEINAIRKHGAFIRSVSIFISQRF